MAKLIDIGVYRPILAVREARRFDLGAALMRIYTCMITIGSVSMLTLMGHSALMAGTVSSVSALACFLISPRISRLIDERGQSSVVPWATAIAMAGLLLMLVTASLALPFWLYYPAGLLMGFVPNPAAIARTRWTYLIKARGEEFGVSSVDVKTVFSYEGVIDDAAFMIGPAASVALAASVAPAAGMGFGGACYLVGCLLLLSSRSTEPQAGWGEEGPAAAEQPAAREHSLFVGFSQVRVLFFLMFFLGALYGTFDTSTVVFAQDLGFPIMASISLVLQSIISVSSGMVFGAMKPSPKLARQFLQVCCLIGGAYACLFLVRDVPSFFLISCVAALFYAPYLITLNTVCERSVPSSRLTEGITWINSGMTFGLAVGPTVGGIFIDLFGSIAGLNTAAVFAIMIPLTALLCSRIVRRAVN
ncbi:MAG: MFS transporter [Coriobacteriales bacterium]